MDEAKYGFRSEEKTVLTVYPVESGEFTDFFFDDDGKTDGYKDNNCVMLKIKVTCDSEKVSVVYMNTGKMDYRPDFALVEGDGRMLIINEA